MTTTKQAPGQRQELSRQFEAILTRSPAKGGWTMS